MRLAVLIDGENVSPRAADELFTAVHERGVATVRRVFGDWQRSAVGGWRDAAVKWAVETVQQCSQKQGDGAADIGITIAAMDLLYAGRIEGFCLVSGDGDFTPLAIRLRDAQRTVYGFGPPTAAGVLRSACTEFIPLSSLGSSKSPKKTPQQTPHAAAEGAVPPADGSVPPIDPAAIELLVRTVQSMAGDNGWVNLAHLGQYLQRNVPGYSPRKLGAASLSRALLRSGAFEISTGVCQGSGRARLIPPHLAHVEGETTQQHAEQAAS